MRLCIPTPFDIITAPLSLVLDELSFANAFIRPNVLMRNRPEVFTFRTNEMVFVVESGAGGIYGHAHTLTQVKSPSKKYAGALVYFTLDAEFMHSHPDASHIYYIAKNGSEYAIFDSKTMSVVTRGSFTAGHWHSLKIREAITVVNITSVENVEKNVEKGVDKNHRETRSKCRR
jgi:hypothetical protein